VIWGCPVRAWAWHFVTPKSGEAGCPRCPAIEETPASKLTPALRRKVCLLALKLGHRIGHTDAGAVEFLISGDGQVYFLEKNTRLQVEHGVT